MLHIDRNNYYGGAEAALSLQEADTWAERNNEGILHAACVASIPGRLLGSGARLSQFSNIHIERSDHEGQDAKQGQTASKLGFSRAYSLSLSPQLIYTRSNLLPALVSSKVYRQLEFLAVGSWWIYEKGKKDGPGAQNISEAQDGDSKGTLRRVPGGREDVFRDTSIDRRSAMSLMKFLKLASDSEAHAEVLDEWGEKPFPDFLSTRYGIPSNLQAPLLALTLSPDTPAETSTSYALPRIYRHLISIGMFGPGFGSVIPKWGGLAEVAQVACRAGAVGGGVYVLKRGLEAILKSDQKGDEDSANLPMGLAIIKIEEEEEIKTKWVVGSRWDLPLKETEKPDSLKPFPKQLSRSITIVSGSLTGFFPSLAEGAPPPASAVVVIPGGSDSSPENSDAARLPVYLTVHASDTGECPAGQCE